MGQSSSRNREDNTKTKYQTLLIHSIRKIYKLITSRQKDASKHMKAKLPSPYYNTNKNDPLVPKPSVSVSSTTPCFVSTSSPLYPGNAARISKHSLLSYALSKLAFFAEISKHRLSDGKQSIKNAFSFHKQSKSKKKTVKSQDNRAEVVQDVNNNYRITSKDLNNNPVLRTKIIKKILSSGYGNINATTPDELYSRNLDKFEKLMAITATIDSSEEDQEYTDNDSKGKDAPRKPRRIITTSKNRVEVDVYFMDWIKHKMSSAKESSGTTSTGSSTGVTSAARASRSRTGATSTTRTRTTGKSLTTGNRTGVSRTRSTGKSPAGTRTGQSRSNLTTATGRNTASTKISTKTRTGTSYGDDGDCTTYYSKGIPAKTISKSNTTKMTSYTAGQATISGKTTPSASAKDVNNNQASNKSLRKLSEATTSSSSGGSSSTGSSATPTPSAPAQQQSKIHPKKSYLKRDNKYFEEKRCINRGSCGGKGGLSAPPAYLDYGSGSGGSAAARRREQDPVLERIKNVDVVEELTYMVPNPNGGGDCESKDDDCEYYAVCESCGEMEPLPEVVKQKIKRGNGASDTTPVKYSRRQRFNFKNKNDRDDDEDGPPFKHEGLQCASCRCSCCVAGLRRNPNCQCKCCQARGPLRRCSSFDETPVGKNPQIRRVLCPEEYCKLKREEGTKLMPENSGTYKFDKKKQKFERQVPRTPSPIILEVPGPRGLKQRELQDITKLLAQKRYENVCQPPVETEPMYLPPIFGQYNNQCPPPCCNPCDPGGPETQQPKDKKTPATAGTEYTYAYTDNSYDYSYSKTSGSYYKSDTKPTSTKDNSQAQQSTKEQEDINNLILHHGHQKSSDSGSLPSS